LIEDRALSRRDFRLLAILLISGVALLASTAASAEAGPVKPDDSAVRLKVYGLKHGHVPVMGRVRLVGTVGPWRSGQWVKVWLYNNGRRFQVRKLRVRKGTGDFGVFRTTVVAKKGARYGARARYPGAGGEHPVKPGHSHHQSWRVRYKALHAGQCGRTVRGFRQALNRIGVVPAGGSCFNGKMQRAVLAYRKLNRLSRNAQASRSIVKRVFNGRGRYRVRRPGLGHHVEAPLDRQVIVFAHGKKPYAIFPIASGKSSTPTILGTYSFYMKTPGYNSHGMYYSSYFIRGYAIHGYASVPNYPASHGCLRTFIADQPRIYKMTEIGMPIATFGNAFRSRTPGGLWSTAGDLGPDLGPAGGLDPAR